MPDVGFDSALVRQALGLNDGETPFPWQIELLKRFIAGDVPKAIDVPTGLGKTSVMAIWLLARASGAKLPRRLVYVVDRRAVVDQATDVAAGLRDLVDRHPNLKQSLHLDADRSLPISTLRGQHVDNKAWLEDPASPAVIVGTVDMIGSRLLFEGYGVRRKMRPYHAGLLGADTLVVLDEAHLVPPFEQLLRTIADDGSAFRPPEEELRTIVPAFQLLSLSATGRTTGSRVMGLTPEDPRHPVAQKRLDAKKHLSVQPLDEGTKLEEELAQHAWNLSSGGKRPVRCIVFCDQRGVAEKAKGIVERLAKGDKKAGNYGVEIASELLVGGRRVFEREQASETLKRLGFIAGKKVERTRPAFLFATSAGEVGVDLDADHMVCDLVAWERMVQRLGRVNRRGEPEEHVARVEVIAEPEPKRVREILSKLPSDRTSKDKEIIDRAERMRAAKESLEQLPPIDVSGFDASPGALRQLKQRAEVDSELMKLLDAATTPAPLRPALTTALVDAWSMTSLENHAGRPAIGPWLRGWIDDDPPQTAILWRRHVPARTSGAAATPKEIEGFFEAAPPHTSELLEIETFRAVEWLSARASTVLSPSAASREENGLQLPRPGQEDVVAFVLESDGDLRTTLRVVDLAVPDDKEAAKDRRDELGEALAGATLIVDARLGGLTDGLLDYKQEVVPRTADDGREWLGQAVVRFRVRNVAALSAVTPDAQWRERFRFAADLSEDGEPQYWLIVEKWCHDAATEEDRSAGLPQLLDEHQSWAEDRAWKLARSLNVPDDYAEVLALAARVHDEGKRAKRWQRAFNAPSEGVYAKTRGPIDYSLLDGYRHELGTLLRIENDVQLRALRADLRDLTLHLVAAHHGFSRPVIGTCGCDDGPPSVLEDNAREIALRFSRLQARWGPWGLAWWESLMRAADQQASRDNELPAKRRGATDGTD